MIEIRQHTNGYEADFAMLAKDDAARRHPWIAALRREGFASFTNLGFPTMRMEEWRHTNIAPIAEASFSPARRETGLITPAELGDIVFGESECCNLVFVNGFYSAELSSPGTLPKGVVAGSLAAALRTDPGKIEPYLARYASGRTHAFVALNTAFLRDGGFIYLPAETILDKVIHLIFLSMPEKQAAVSHPRNLIIVERGSQASVVESYVGPRRGVYFTNAVTEIVAGDGAVVGHYKLQRESEESFHVGSLHVHQQGHTDVSSHLIALGGVLARNDITAVMDGEGGELLLNGLYVTKNRQHMDNHTSIVHARPHCASRELYKGILDNQSSAVFNGRIVVKPDAQKTNAKQTNKNLLLSRDALVNSQPQLEIFADDVKCTHGATIGRLNEDELFYLRSRGIGEQAARSLLTYAFACDVAGAVKIKPLQCQLDLVLLARMSRAEGGNAPL